MTTILILFVLVFAGLVLRAAWSVRRENERTERLRAAAPSLGLAFEGARPDVRLAEFGGLPLFCRGGGREAFNVMIGSERDIELAVFDYRFVTGSRKKRKTHEQTVVWMKLRGARLPSFALAPEGVIDKIGAVFGKQDIDFSTHVEFSRRFVLRGELEPAVRKLFTPRVLDDFGSLEPVTVEGEGDKLVVYHDRFRHEPEALRAFIDRGLAIADVLVARAE